MPETGDTDFSWREFLRRNNDELVATYGNLAHRVLTFAYRNFDGAVPAPGEIDNQGQRLLAKAQETLNDIDRLIYGCHFKAGIKAAMSLAQEANRYLDDKAPWKAIKEDKQASATATFVALSVLAALKTILYPYLPFSSEKLHKFLGFDGSVETNGWQVQSVVVGQKLTAPQPLFRKLDDSIIDEETSRLVFGGSQ